MTLGHPFVPYRYDGEERCIEIVESAAGNLRPCDKREDEHPPAEPAEDKPERASG